MTLIEALPGYVAGHWTLDPGHSHIGFSVRHMMVSKVRGSFTTFSGSITTAEDPLASSATLTVDLGSVDTGNDDRDAHLRSGDFFDAQSHPAMTYRTTSLRWEGGDVEVTGDLTIKDVTRPVTLVAEYNGIGADPWGGTRLGLSAHGEIGRSDFGITFNMPLDGGGVMVGERVQLLLEVEAVLDRDA
ncbi:MAG TPA: YceI family protein [Acidimicrobiales bacterium]|nr:YceI family protein [Acidimicrobiales bacterium]